MEDSSTYRCIFCLQTDGGFQKEAHVIPESACNENLVLPKGRECDRCNNEFSAIEQPIIRSFPGQIFRVGFVKKTGRGDKPTADIKGGKITREDTAAGSEIRIYDTPEILTWLGITLSWNKVSSSGKIASPSRVEDFLRSWQRSRLDTLSPRSRYLLHGV